MHRGTRQSEEQPRRPELVFERLRSPGLELKQELQSLGRLDFSARLQSLRPS